MNERRRDRGSDSVTVVRLLRQCAALLRGGLQPERAFHAITAGAEDDVDRGLAAQVAQAVTEGVPVATVLGGRSEPEWRLTAAAWTLAVRSGAPLAPVLERLADALQSLVQLMQRRSVLLAGPRATILLVAGLPALAILMGMLLGFDPLGVLLTPFGAVLMVTGTMLEATGILWASRLARSVAAADRVTAIECELTWVAMQGGVPPQTARRWVAEAIDRAQTEWVTVEDLCDDSPLGRILEAAAAAGVPAGPLLLETSASARREAHAELERRAERLGVRVLIPLAVCILPAFVLLAVIPVLVSLFGGAGVSGP